MPNDSDPRSQLLDEIIAEYLQAIENDQAPSREELLALHPDLEVALRELLDQRDQLKAWSGPDDSSTSEHTKTAGKDITTELCDELSDLPEEKPGCAWLTLSALCLFVAVMLRTMGWPELRFRFAPFGPTPRELTIVFVYFLLSVLGFAAVLTAVGYSLRSKKRNWATWIWEALLVGFFLLLISLVVFDVLLALAFLLGACEAKQGSDNASDPSTRLETPSQ